MLWSKLSGPLKAFPLACEMNDSNSGSKISSLMVIMVTENAQRG